MLICSPITQNVLGDIDPVPSPSGRYVVFRRMTSYRPSVGELTILDMEGDIGNSVVVDKERYHGGASWSPDGLWLSYTAWERSKPGKSFIENSIYGVSPESMTKVRLVDGRTMPGIGEYTSWISESEVVFATQSVFYKVNSDSRQITEIARLRTEFVDHPRHLSLDPTGSILAFSIEDRDDDDRARSSSGIWLLEIRSGTFLQLTSGMFDTFPVWMDENTLLFQREVSPPVDSRYYSLRTVSLQDGRIDAIEFDRHVFSISSVPTQGSFFAATSNGWDLADYPDLNFFHGFSISKCKIEDSDTPRSQ